MRTVRGRMMCAILCALAFLGVREGPRGGVTIHGRVTESVTGGPLESANIFLAGTTIGTVTDRGGDFALRGIPSGTYQLVVSRVGYRSSVSSVEISSTELAALSIVLEPRDLVTEEITVEAGDAEEWRRCLERFIPAFIGKGPNAALCTIINPEVMNFQPTESADELVAWSDSALVIDNFSLGYRLAVVVERFEWNTRQDLGLYGIYPRFEELTPGSFQGLDRWNANRRKTYTGSLKHFLSLLARGELAESGFVMFEGGVSSFPLPPEEILIRPAANPAQRQIHFAGWLRVEYQAGVPPSVSYMQMQEPFARIDTAGNLLTPFAISLAGDWAGRRVSDLLPRF